MRTLPEKIMAEWVRLAEAASLDAVRVSTGHVHFQRGFETLLVISHNFGPESATLRYHGPLADAYRPGNRELGPGICWDQTGGISAHEQGYADPGVLQRHIDILAAMLPAAPRIDLTARFALDDAAARQLAEGIVAAYGEDASPGGSAPRFSAAWDPRVHGEEDTVRGLVRYAADHGIITCPPGMNLDYIYDPDNGDAGSYHFTVDIGHNFTEQVTIQSWPAEMRRLVSDDDTGAAAAVSILVEAESRANGRLDRLAALIITSRLPAPGPGRRAGA